MLSILMNIKSYLMWVESFNKLLVNNEAIIQFNKSHILIIIFILSNSCLIKTVYTKQGINHIVCIGSH